MASTLPFKILEGADNLRGKEALTLAWADGEETVEIVSQQLADYLRAQEDARTPPTLRSLTAQPVFGTTGDVLRALLEDLVDALDTTAHRTQISDLFARLQGGFVPDDRVLVEYEFAQGEWTEIGTLERYTSKPKITSPHPLYRPLFPPPPRIQLDLWPSDCNQLSGLLLAYTREVKNPPSAVDPSINSWPACARLRIKCGLVSLTWTNCLLESYDHLPMETKAIPPEPVSFGFAGLGRSCLEIETAVQS